MSDLHQYELRYAWTEPTTGGATTLTRLVWAYTVQEAVFQLDFELKPRGDRYYRITEAGPVKKAPSYAPGTRFHVCLECQDIMPCFSFNPWCEHPEQSDSHEPCQKCMGKKPHKHFCPICEVEYDCMWIERLSSCGNPGCSYLHCAKHPEWETGVPKITQKYPKSPP